MNVFSCFDGASCGQLALKKLGIPITNYYASEIDKYAIQVTQANFPNTIQLGDITTVNPGQLPKIDLMMGGSPCQGFSFAGKQLNFDDPRSKLFFDFIKLRDKLKPKYVLLENVRMKKESEDIISDYMGCKPIKINSALLSAQSRNRLYWFVKLVGDKYIPVLTFQPHDKGIVIKDILEELPFGTIPNYLANSWGGEPRGNKVKSIDDSKANCLTASMYKGQIPTYVKKLIPKENPTLSKDGLIRVGSADLKGHDSIKRVYSRDGKAPTLTTMQGGHREPKVALSGYAWRKLTPLECERLQTMPDNYTNHVSNTQRYKMIGNGWTVDVIAHILKGIQHG
jgi:DNA (cytosine-5)-methyltransferase 3A